MEPININLPWMDIVNQIDMPGGWKQRYRLDVSHRETIYADPPEWWKSGGRIWYGANYMLFIIGGINTEGKEFSTVGLNIEDDKPTSAAIFKVWSDLKNLSEKFQDDSDTKHDELEVPRRGHISFEKWCRRWEIVRPMVESGIDSIPSMLTYIELQNYDLKCKEDTLRKVIAAGKAHLLDPLKTS
jgi:hypothetical protein